MADESWASEESRMFFVAGRAFVRALRRPRRLLLITIVVAVAVLAWRMNRPPTYVATVYLRIEEGAVTDPGTGPAPPAALRQFISNVALSDFQLERLMRKHRVSLPWLARDRYAAIDDFRDEIGVEVSQNYLTLERRPDDPPRSALVAISVAGSELEWARAIAYDIAETVMRAQSSLRTDALADEGDLLKKEIAQGRARVRTLQRSLDTVSARAANAAPSAAIALGAKAAVLRAETDAAIAQLLALERRATKVTFNAAAERDQVAFAFGVVDEAIRVRSPRLTPRKLAAFALLTLVITALVAMPLLGAFDDRVYVPEDLSVWKIPVFGAIPRFTGDESGALRRRATAMYD